MQSKWVRLARVVAGLASWKKAHGSWGSPGNQSQGFPKQEETEAETGRHRSIYTLDKESKPPNPQPRLAKVTSDQR